MRMWFHSKLKAVEAAFRDSDPKPLKRKWNRFAESILDTLSIIEAADTIGDLRHFFFLNPHKMHKDRSHPNERYSLSPAGAKNSLRITLVCCNDDGSEVFEKIDPEACNVIIEEVSNHYGD